MTEIILVTNGHLTKSYRKLMYGQINDTKHTKTFISRPFGNSLDLRLVVVGDFFFFFAHGARVGRQKKYFRSGAETKLFYIDFDGSVGKPETRLFFYAIESPCHVVGPH